MYRKGDRASARTAMLVVTALTAATFVLTTQPALAATDDCFVVADNQQVNEDLLTAITPERGTTTPIPERTIGETGTFGIESLATKADDPLPTLWAADKDRLGTLDNNTAAFTPKPQKFGSGNGALGTQTFGNVDATAFTGEKLYGTDRDEEGPDLLFQINPDTGERVKDAFGPGVDYRVVPSPDGRHNVDALVATSGTMYAILNERGGKNSVLATIDPNTAAVTVIGSTSPADDVEGMAIGATGAWYINGKDFNGNNGTFVWEADLATGSGTNPRRIGLTNGAYDYEGITCRQEPVGLEVLKFNDVNGNGVRELGEPLLPGWMIHVIGADGSHIHQPTGPDGITEFTTLTTGVEYLVCEQLQPNPETDPANWTQTAPITGADCTGHTHGDTIVPGPRGFSFVFGQQPGTLEFGNREVSQCVSSPAVSKNARAFGLRADLLGGGLILGDPDIAPTPDSDVTNPDELLSVPNVLDPTSPPLVSLLRVSEEETADSTTATATTAAVDLSIPGLAALRVQADAVVAKSTSYLEETSTGANVGASSSSEGSTIANLRIGGVQYGDVSEPLTVVINDPLNPGTPFIEVHVLERVRRGAAAGIVQTGSTSTSGLDVNGIHVVVHDLALTAGLDESSDIIVAHAETDIAFTRITTCPTPSGRAYAAQLFNVTPNLASAIVGEVVLPSTGGTDAEHLADVDISTVLVADAASTSTTGAVTSIDPDAAEAASRAVITDAQLSTLVSAKLIEATANASCSSPPAAPTSCSDSTIGGDTVIADVDILGTDVCGALMLTSTCHPAPNTVFLDLPILRVVLNEQIVDADGRGITVNAIHVWVLGAVPGSTLPVGAEVIISSAYADTHPRA